jgi:serine O-acetyltransferase
MTEKQKKDWSCPMWQREEPKNFWDPSRKLLKSIRQYQVLAKSNNPIHRVRAKVCAIRHRFWSVVTGAEIDLNCQIGGGLLLPHPNGVVIHPDAIIGPNCLIFQQVTLAGAVTLGYHVDLGAGAKILGPLRIGNHVNVGANAVVTKDTASNQTVVGIPAKAI